MSRYRFMVNMPFINIINTRRNLIPTECRTRLAFNHTKIELATAYAETEPLVTASFALCSSSE